MPTSRSCHGFRALTTLLMLTSAAPALGAQGVRITLAAWPESVLMDTLRKDYDMSVPPAKVYEAALKAFSDLGIPTGQTDGKAGIIGSERFERTRTFLNAPMSRSFSCGEGLAGPYADSFRLEIAIVVWVKAAGAGTKLGIASIAGARDVSGASHGARNCSSTGAIEEKISDRIAKLTAVNAP